MAQLRFDNTRVRWQTATDLQVADLVDGYDASILYADRWIGWLLHALESRGRLANTLVVIVSDHGELLRDEGPFIGHHHGVSRAEIHVPLVIAGPGIPRGIRVPDAVTTAAIPTTILELVGASTTGFGSRSLAGFFTAKPDAGRPFSAIAELAPEDLEPTLRRTGWERALVTGPWYYVEKAGAKSRLFLWDAHPASGKLSDVTETPRGRQVVSRLAEWLRRRVGPLPASRSK
jgi:arylsulfatase A-like enzyme